MKKLQKQIRIDDIDVVFDPKPLAKDEEQQISDFIKQDKAKRKREQKEKLPDTL